MDLTGKMKKKQKFIPDYLNEMSAIMRKMNASLIEISKNIEILKDFEAKRKEVIGRMAESANNNAKKQEENADDQQIATEKKGRGKKGGVNRGETAPEEGVQ